MLQETFEWNKKHILTLIELFKSKPLLWDHTDLNYRDRHHRKIAYMEMAVQLGTCVEDVENKLHIIKSQFFREWGKVQRSKTEQKLYESRWYGFELLSFLKGEHAIVRPRKSHIKESVRQIKTELTEEIIIPFDESSIEDISATASTHSNYQEHNINKVKKRRTESEENNTYIINDDCSARTSSQDEIDIVSKHIALKLKKLNPETRIYAEKLINDVLYHAQLGDLTRSSFVSV